MQTRRQALTPAEATARGARRAAKEAHDRRREEQVEGCDAQRRPAAEPGTDCSECDLAQRECGNGKGARRKVDGVRGGARRQRSRQLRDAGERK